MTKVLLVLSAVSALVACADPSAPPARVYDDGNYLTGSHLPRRASTMPRDVQTVAPAALEDWQRKPPLKSAGGGF